MIATRAMHLTKIIIIIKKNLSQGSVNFKGKKNMGVTVLASIVR